jgi:RNA polymerase sigma-70 factor (ECF subfamily)
VEDLSVGSVAEPTGAAERLRRSPLVFAEVYREHAPFVWRSLRRLGVPVADLDDVCQETFLVVHRQLERYDGSSSVKTWLFGIAMRLASNHRRKLSVRRENPGAVAPEPSVPAPQPEVVAARQARVVLDQALDSLDDEKRAVFVLYELEQLPMSEVVAAVGCPLQTAYSRLHAARKLVAASVHRFRSKEGS